MKAFWIVLIVIAFLGVLFLSWILGSYNGLVTKEEGVNSAWAQVENVYQRRNDLIPNLVETVKGYAAHEQNTFEGVIEARAKATQMTIDPKNLTPEKLQEFQANQNGLSQALGKLMVVVERYPDLKANQNFLDLQAQLEGTENRIAVERKNFNDVAQVYNTSRRSFPTIIVASMLGFDEKPYFKTEEGANNAPTVKF